MPFPVGFVTNESLFIKGYPDKSGVAPLFMGPSQRLDSDISLTITGPASSEAPLFIGFEDISSGSFMFYTLGEQGFGGGPDQKSSSLTLKGTSATPYFTTNTLVVQGPEKDDRNSVAALFIESGPTPVGSGSLQFFTEGANPTVSNPVLDDSSTSLYIRNAETFDSNTTLFVEKGFNTAETASLFVKSSNPSGVVALYSSGVGVTTTSSDLLIKAPEVKTTNLFSRGYN